MLDAVIQGFLLGLSAGIGCVAFCAPLLGPLFLLRSRATWGYSATALMEFLAGRLVAYLAVGAALGALGAAAAVDRAAPLLVAANIPLGLAMILVAISDRPQDSALCRFAHRAASSGRMPLLLGLFTGLSPCPPFVKAVHAVISIGGLDLGMAFFLAFFAATTLYLLPLMFLGLASAARPLRAVGHAVAGAAGLIYLTAGVQALTPARATVVEVNPRLATFRYLVPDAPEFSEKLGSPPFYHEARRRVGGRTEVVGYVAVTTDAAPEVRGYGGPVPVLVAVDTKGVIRGVKVLENLETPEFAAEVMSESFAARFVGKALSSPLKAGVDVDAVTGATVTSTAVIDGVRAAARRLGAQALQAQAVADSGSRWLEWLRPTPWVFLAFLVVGALGDRLRAPWLRPYVLLLAVGALGFWLRAMFSAAQVVDLARLDLPPLSSATWYALAVPPLAASLLFGRVYCGWACPFGAAAELLGSITGTPLRPDPRLDRRLRWIKYLILVTLPVLVVIAGDTRPLAFEPFRDVFTLSFGSGSLWRAAWLVLLAVGSMLVFRFFCRYLCPAGAAMAFLARYRVFGRLKPEGCFGCAECLTPCPMGTGAMATPDSECIVCHACARCARRKTSGTMEAVP